MKFRACSWIAAAAILISVRAEEVECAGFLRAAAPIDSPDYRKYAPEQQADMEHLAVDITPDFHERSIQASTTLRFRPLADISELKLNAMDLRVSAVKGTGNVRNFQSTPTELIIHFDPPLPKGSAQELTITYTAFPRQGIYFRTKEMGYLAEDEHLFTQGEAIEAQNWIPCFDAPNDKITSEITCHVPEQMLVLSNGRLVSDSVEQGIRTTHWLQDKPHTTYLISLVAGHFKKIEATHRDIPLAFYTPPSQSDLAERSFAETKEMMQFFEEEIGVPYPWDKYYQVCVQDFVAGGMENTSITTLTDHTLYPSETENIRSSRGLVAHELAHQWFGDLVTCRDWSHIWLNEGFATYYAHLYELHKGGRDAFLYSLYNSARGWIGRSTTEDSRPIVFRRYDKPSELFGYLVYPKGGWVLHMLRNELGPEVYRKAIKSYLERHRFGNVITQDLMRAFEEASGRPMDQFFDQWVFHPHHPEIQAAWSWDDSKKMAKLTLTQVQQLTNDVALFDFPLGVRFKGPFGTTNLTLRVKQKSEDFFFALPQAPVIVRLDPEYALLAKFNFEPPRNMLIAQLHDDSDVMGRIFAVQALSKSKDNETVKLLAQRLKEDPFYGVRIEAAEALRTIHSDEALAALIDNAAQPDARVRQKVVAEIAKFFKPRAREFNEAVPAAEKNPDISSQALSGLGAWPAEQVRPILDQALKTPSFDDIVSDAAISALRQSGDPSSIPGILAELAKRETGPRSRSLARGLDAVAWLARNEQKKDDVYQFILKYVSHPREPVRLGAIRALGTLKDERAIPLLNTFASGASDLPETTAAKRSLDIIQGNRPVATEVQGLRNELLELRKQQEDLKKNFEELRKKFEASPKGDTPGDTPPKTRSQVKARGRAGKNF